MTLDHIDDVVFIQRIQQSILRKEALLSPCLGSIKTQSLNHALSVHEEHFLVDAQAGTLRHEDERHFL